ncbi:superoxide dismutase [Hyalangium minutum]|uniref:superoxide dismutase n=1 Tax=Hyalangium minutum TaxID=394096 RepID=A0A085W5U6_9BACT|nr:Fe-Mn family superoxide dismutase [Hyalangium minutum]KFE63059.1 Superoxide dismutase [Hyalangium minutum]
MADKKYTPMQFPNCKGLKGISDAVLEVHFKLYEGYVNRTNKLTETLSGMATKGEAAGTNPMYAEMTRRLGFEYNGVVLHEYYFGNLKAGGSGATPPAKLKKAMEESFGSFETWLADFKAISTMPGIGWAVTFQDPRTGWLSNHWITLHETNNIAGFKPIIVMDAWEHAFVPDYKANERAKYVDAYFSNLDFDAAEGRLK